MVFLILNLSSEMYITYMHIVFGLRDFSCQSTD